MAHVDYTGTGGEPTPYIPPDEPTPYIPPESEIGWVAESDTWYKGIESWAGYFKTAIEAPYRPWVLPELWGKTAQIGTTALTTGKLPKIITAPTYEIPGWPEFPGWPDIPDIDLGLGDVDWTKFGESATKFGTMAILGLGIVAVIMFLK